MTVSMDKQYHKLWDMYSDLKKQLELATKDSK
jgi:hypothetical protein